MSMHGDTSDIGPVPYYLQVYIDPPCFLTLCTCHGNSVVNHFSYRLEYEDKPDES